MNSLMRICTRLVNINIEINILPHKTRYVHRFPLQNLFHTTIHRNAKSFVDTENFYAHQILENLPEYRKTVLPGDARTTTMSNKVTIDQLVTQSWAEESPSAIVVAFKKLAGYAQQNNLNISETMFNPIIEALLSRCRQLTDEDLSEVLIALSIWPEPDFVNSNNFGDMWSALDDMCIERHKEWSHDQLLYFADHWFKLNLAKVCEYSGHCIKRLSRRPNQLSPSQLVQTMFLFNVCRRSPANMYDFEHHVGKCMDELRLDELAILSMAFFKTQSTIKDSTILSRLVDRVVNEASSIHEISLCAIMKVLRFSRHLPIVDKLKHLLDVLVPEIDRLSLLSCVHIGLAGTNCQLFHPESLSKISQKLVTNIKTARLKDIERISFAISLFNYNPPTDVDIYELFKQELNERDEEIDKYPRCLTSTLHFLSLRGIYATDLIDRAMNPSFLERTFGKFHPNFGREIFHLDSSLKIDVPDYTGHKLNDKTRLALAKRHTHWAPSSQHRLSAADKQMLNIIDSMEQMLGGNKYLVVEHVVPHFERPDIIMAFDREQRPIHIKNVFKKYQLSDIKYAPVEFHEGSKWIAVVIAGWNSIIRNQNAPVGSMVMKLKHLERIGYNSVMISWYDWIQVPAADKQDYLKRKINNL